MKLRSGEPFWLATAKTTTTYPALSGDARCDVLILGGGITGALIAYYLAADGVDVLLVDQRELGHGSTAASTGLLQYEVDTPLTELIGKVGEANAVRAYRRGLEAIDEIQRLTTELSDSCGFERRESLYFAGRFWHYRKLKREFDCRKRFGFDVDFLTRRELRQISSIHAAGAIRSRGDAQIDPLRFTERLLAAATERGLRAYSKTEVLNILEDLDQVVARTATGKIRAKAIVYATGYDSRPFLDSARGSLHSTYAVAGRTGSEVPGWPNQCLLWETARPYFYARRLDNGRVMFGGEDTPFANDHDRDALLARCVAKLIARFQRLFPEAQFEPEYSWAGTFGATKDGLAYIGRPADRPRAYFALGYGGNGITFSVIAARLISDLFAGRPNPDATVFSFQR